MFLWICAFDLFRLAGLVTPALALRFYQFLGIMERLAVRGERMVRRGDFPPSPWPHPHMILSRDMGSSWSMSFGCNGAMRVCWVARFDLPREDETRRYME